jgi:hypothetical protein
MAAVAHFLWKAPRPQQALLWLIALAYIGIVLGPDLLLGGIRSNHIRYGLPAVLAIQLMVAWSIGSAFLRGGNAAHRRQRRSPGAACCSAAGRNGASSRPSPGGTSSTAPETSR